MWGVLTDDITSGVRSVEPVTASDHEEAAEDIAQKGQRLVLA